MPEPVKELLLVLNEASLEEFGDRYKVSADVARQIIAHRPYQSDVDFLERAILPKRTYEQLVTQIVTARASEIA